MARRPTRQVGSPNLAIGYVRVSTDEQKLSPDAQERTLREWCAARKIALLEVHYDRGVSGGLPIDERPGLMDAVAAVERTGAGVFVVAKRDRMARNVLEAALLERLLDKTSCRAFSCAGEGTDAEDPNDPMAFMVKGLFDLLAQWERLTIKQRTKVAMNELRRKGKCLGSAPYGYRAVGKRKHGEDTTLVPEINEQRAITNAKAWRERGFSYREIGRLLLDAGFYPRDPTKNWYAIQVQRMCEGPGGVEVGYNPQTDR